MIVTLTVVSWEGFSLRHMRSGDIRGSMAWSRRDKETGDWHVFVRRGMDLWLFGLARIGHELEHCLDPSFDNEDHHPASHLCGRSFFPVRRWKHFEKVTKAQAREFRRTGRLEVNS